MTNFNFLIEDYTGERPDWLEGLLSLTHIDLQMFTTNTDTIQYPMVQG